MLKTDASDHALGGARLQPNDDGKLKPIAFTSSSMSLTEQRYSRIEKECLVICNCSQRFDPWLYGRSGNEEKRPSPPEKDSDETAAISIQPNLQERADNSPGRHFLGQPLHSQYQQE